MWASGGFRSRWDILAAVAVGGALGSLARWGVSAALTPRPGTFPWATFGINVTGSLLLGALIVLAAEVWPPSRYARPFLAVGVLGGYTTFSAYMLDTRSLLVTGHPVLAASYLFGSLAAGLMAVWAGVVSVRSVIRVARWRVRRQAEDRYPAGGSQGRDPAASARAPSAPGSPR